MGNVAKDFAQLISQSKSNKTGPYDTQATVKRVEGNTAWVSIPGGVDETPIDKTVNCAAGDKVQVRVSGGRAWITGNASAPPTDDKKANEAKATADTAQIVAVDAKETADAVEGIAQAAQHSADTAARAAAEAVDDAGRAQTAADTANNILTGMQNAATAAGTTLNGIYADAETAKTNAQTAITNAAQAKTAADNASEYAARALGNLSTVQSVSETLTWITQHGTMALTTDVTPDPTHVYFVVDAGGDYTVGGVTYAIVTEPVTADMGTYYELSIDESLNNYVGTHLALDGEGLWLLPAISGTNKVLIATGAGSTYTTAGTYIIDSGGTVMASFRANGATINGGSGTLLAQMGFGQTDSGSGTTNSPFYTFGTRKGTVGSFSFVEGYGEASKPEAHAEGYDTTASGLYAHAEGYKTTASGYYAAHAEGGSTTASGQYSHAEGNTTTSSGHMSHAEGGSTTASAQYGHAEGYQTTASGTYGSHAEGWNTTASGDWAHAEGRDTAASGNYAHAEGTSTTASANNAHAEGSNTTAGAANAHAQNLRTKASSASQTALGKYNVEDSADTYAVIIGNGTADNARSNALTVKWNGDVKSSGDIEDGSGNVLADKADTSAVPTKTSDLVNDSGYITGYTETDPVFSASAASGITSSDISTWNGKSDFSGSYTDLTNKPTIPSKTSDLTNDSGFVSLITEEKSIKDNVTVNGSGTKYTDGNASVAKTGYTPLGVVGFRVINASSSGTNGANVVISHAYISGTTAYFRVKNTETSSAKVRIYFTILYAKA